MANGELSQARSVTSGIRQGCPLAPLLFILAVDLLYDEIDGEVQVQSIELDPAHPENQLKIAGYADDTAINIRHHQMQTAVVRAVGRFSRVSGLMLNVRKSAAIALGRKEIGSEIRGDTNIDTTQDRGGSDQVVPATDSARYLGHIAGNEGAAEEAWEKTFKAFTVRHTLAVGKQIRRNNGRQSQQPS